MNNGNPLNTREIRNLLVRMERLKGQMLMAVLSGKDPRITKVKVFNIDRRLKNLGLELRRLQNKAYKKSTKKR